jgi:hypothetical protein
LQELKAGESLLLLGEEELGGFSGERAGQMSQVLLTPEDLKGHRKERVREPWGMISRGAAWLFWDTWSEVRRNNRVNLVSLVGGGMVWTW